MEHSVLVTAVRTSRPGIIAAPTEAAHSLQNALAGAGARPAFEFPPRSICLCTAFHLPLHGFSFAGIMAAEPHSINSQEERTLSTTTLAQAVWPRPNAHPAAARTRDIALVFIFSLLTAVCAQIALPLPLVPITLQTFAVLLTGALLGPRLGALSLLLYLLEGAMGLPVFAGARSAWSPSTLPLVPTILGPTAGYLVSYPVAAGLTGWLAARGWDRRAPFMLCAMLLGSLVIYAGGALWLAHFLGWHKAVLVGVAPFLAGDIVKALAAAALLPPCWKALGRRG